LMKTLGEVTLMVVKDPEIFSLKAKRL